MATGSAWVGRHSRRPSGLCLKTTLVVFLGLFFIIVLSSFSSSSAPSQRRSSFTDIPSGKSTTVRSSPSPSVSSPNTTKESHVSSLLTTPPSQHENKTKGEEIEIETETVEVIESQKEPPSPEEEAEKIELAKGKKKTKKKKKVVPLFDDKAEYSWSLCDYRSKYNYIPCVDNENSGRKGQSYRHSERSCPAVAPTCLVPLPEGYRDPVRWAESKSKVWYKNVAHPQLAAFIKRHGWLRVSDDFLNFPDDESEFKGGDQSYIESIEEMVPDIEWGKNIRLVLDIGCMDASFGFSLLEKDALTLSLGLKDDLVDLVQVVLERGMPAMIAALATKRLPFPSGVFDAVHCGICGVNWHANGGRLLLEMNRILRPGGYFFMSVRSEDIDHSEAMAALTASMCWNILAHKTHEASETGVKIYQKPSSNDIYVLRRKDVPLCDEEDNPDAAWYTPMNSCLNMLPASIEQRGSEWPEDWPKRLENFPEWLSYSRENFVSDTEHWKVIVSNSYTDGLGVDWASVRNIIDMKTIYGGLAAALVSQKVWVMNVVPTNAPDTLSIIFERGLLGIYHDWCEPFSTHPRSYDLLHADHLFSSLTNRCKALGVIVEMDRILRPGGWAIVRDTVEILNPLEAVLRSLHWDIRTTYSQDKEGMLCAQKSMWRP